MCIGRAYRYRPFSHPTHVILEYAALRLQFPEKNIPPNARCGHTNKDFPRFKNHAARSQMRRAAPLKSFSLPGAACGCMSHRPGPPPLLTCHTFPPAIFLSSKNLSSSALQWVTKATCPPFNGFSFPKTTSPQMNTFPGSKSAMRVLGRGVEVKGNDGEIVTFFLSGKG